jgi:hypothetical protein
MSKPIHSFRDFFNRPFKVGDYVVGPSRGNVTCEYGSILYQVTSISPNLDLTRIKVNHSTHTYETTTVSPSNFNKYTIISVPQKYQDLFQKALRSELNGNEHIFILSWIHGIEPEFDRLDEGSGEARPLGREG